MSVRNCAISAATLACLLLMSTGAQADDPPLRVGRVSYLEGTVSFHAADEDDWSYATLNYPVVSGNAFWTEPDGRSEVQIGSVEVRMDHSTEMEVTQLDENNTRLEVPQGIVNIHFSTPPVNGVVEVMTPEGPIELTRPGTYHIDSGQPTVNSPSTQVQVTALEGQLDIRGPRSLLEVMPGETATLSGNPPAFSLQEGNPTPFDDWALARERREEAHNTGQFVSPHTTGYEDLDYYGQWSSDPSYGNVWYPTVVQADWAPYRYGHWAYVAPWGWTWVDNAAWGFAPFHYGRWAYVGNRWGWVPGEVVERPVYAPALVAFVGGAGWRVSLSVGSAPAVGWVPLGPREVFHPYYPTTVEYARNVNLTSVSRTEINNITVNNIHNVNVTNYVNSQRGATVVPTQAFQQGQPVHKAFVPMSHDQLAHAPMTPTLAHIVPSNAARAEGRPVPSSMQEKIPNPAAEDTRNHGYGGKNPYAPVVNAVQQPHTPEAPQEPQEPKIVHVTPRAPEEQHAPEQHAPEQHAPEQHAAPAGWQESHAASPATTHAPGPQIRRAPVQQQQAVSHAETSKAPKPELPRAEVPHPEQQTHITPTPQGWQRTPAPHQLPQTHEAPHPPASGDPHKKEEQH